jgi:hypothetical protein
VNLTTIFEQLCELHQSISAKRSEIDELFPAVHPSGRRVVDEYLCRALACVEEIGAIGGEIDRLIAKEIEWHEQKLGAIEARTETLQ